MDDDSFDFEFDKEDGLDEEVDDPPARDKPCMKKDARDQRRLLDARERRTVLKLNGLATYELTPGEASIVCLCCGMASANLGDIREKYCAFCHEFHLPKLKRD